jgi:deoxyguanosine kinase
MYIAFEGPIAAGKTTLATMLAKHVGSASLLEEFIGNEFLDDFYRNAERWSLPMQLWFLAERKLQLGAITVPLRFSVIADYSYLKNSVFSQILLKDRELRLYDKLACILAENGARPDLIVYLDAANDVLLERIRGRNRPSEASIEASYLDTLRDAYRRTLLCESSLNVLRYDTSDLDLTSEEQMNNLYATIIDAV